MLETETKNYPLSAELKERIDEVLESHAYDSTQIVGILLDVQELDERNYVPDPTAYIFDILNFYSELSTKPRAKYPIEVCFSPSCRVHQFSSPQLIETLETLLGIKIGETTYDGRFRLEQVTCIGACDRAPAVRINGKVYDHLDTKEKITALLHSLG